MTIIFQNIALFVSGFIGGFGVGFLIASMVSNLEF